MGLEQRGYLGKIGDEKDLQREDERAALTALKFAIEVLQESKDPRISTRANEHYAKVGIALYHQHRADWIRELPRKVPAKRKPRARQPA